MTKERLKTKVQMGNLKPAHEVFDAIVDPDKVNKYFITTNTGRFVLYPDHICSGRCS